MTGTIGRYRHHKGQAYRVVAVALCEADHELQVIYQSEADGLTWTRPAPEFFGIVELPGGRWVRRFAPMPPDKP